MKNFDNIEKLGLGTYMLQGDVLKQALDFALFLGYRHIDTAALYENETEIGEVLGDRIQAGKLSRKDVFITTKIPSTWLRKSDTLESAHKSLGQLKMKNVDMLLIHHPWGQVKRKEGEIAPLINNSTGKSEIENVDFLETWTALESLFKDDFTKNIGLSNFTIGQIQRVLSAARIPPANVQLECHAYYQQQKLKAFCDSNDIALSAYAPIGAVNRPDIHKHNTENLTEDPLIIELSEKYEKTPAQILLNFLLCRGFAVLPKSSSPGRLEENFNALSFELSEEDNKKIYTLDRGVRFYNFLYIHHHPEFIENEEF
ncbi:1,5-anhydro-D-fructose reductase [Aplysia californica]|uniref:1,5-anhydro-D-fructose reductase n=1 Tax=Aplysia californica TaxID=6500 RepID=A0ABM0K1A9_APLCA|nr:1,5-anhydro-D-fructose reductase [Aplysia californica]